MGSSIHFFYVQATYYDHTKISLTDGQNRIYSGTNCMYYYTNAPVTTLYGNLHTQKYQNHIFSARSEICKSSYKILDECLRAIHTYIHTYIHTNIHTALCRLITREVKPNCRNHCRMHSSCMEHNDEDTKMLQGVWSGATTVGCTADAWNIMMKIQKFVRCIVQKVAIFNIEQWVMP